MNSDDSAGKGKRSGVVPHETLENAQAEIARLRAMTFEERARLIVAACRAAAKIERSRQANGLPPTVSAPWPASTWEFLKRSASDARR